MFYDTLHNQHSRRTTLLAVTFLRLKALGQGLGRYLVQRKALRDLSHLDDHILKDIGISRGGIRSAVRYGRNSN